VTSLGLTVKRSTLNNYPELRHSLGDPEVDPQLLDLALTHRSFAYENGGLPTNERLEFLGDSVLGMVITEALYTDHPGLAEGKLARLRAAVVNSRALAEVAGQLGVGPNIKLGRGEATTGGAEKASILADTLEAIIGAVHLTAGIQEAHTLIHRIFTPVMVAAAQQGAGLDWKTSLQELASARGLGSPEYIIFAEGPDHSKVFTASAKVADKTYGPGVGSSKKIAEQAAAKMAYAELFEREAK
jgi:ribonuclease III